MLRIPFVHLNDLETSEILDHWVKYEPNLVVSGTFCLYKPERRFQVTKPFLGIFPKRHDDAFSKGR